MSSLFEWLTDVIVLWDWSTAVTDVWAWRTSVTGVWAWRTSVTATRDEVTDLLNQDGCAVEIGWQSPEFKSLELSWAPVPRDS